MNNFFNELHWVLSQVPRDNYWKHGKTEISQRTRIIIELVAASAHSIFFVRFTKAEPGYFFSTLSDLKTNSKTIQAFGISRIPQKTRDVEFVRKSFYQALLFCCDESELENHTWFQEDEACDSISHQLDSISAIQREEFILNGNLERHPYPMFQDAIYAWNGSSCRLSEIESKLDDAISFHEPPARSTVYHAWGYVKKILRDGKNRKIEQFLKLYLSLLEETIFHQIPWNDDQKYYWLKDWENKLFGNISTKSGSSPGRWQQGNAVDYIKAAKLILYFVEDFLQNPKNTKSGEIACILWLMLWCAYYDYDDVKESDVITLTTDNFLNGDKLKLRNHSFKISKGLFSLLKALFGNGSGIRARRIFTYIKNEKALARALEEASRMVLNDEIPITPGAFLHFPHIWTGIHLSKRERATRRKARHIIEPQLPEKYVIEAKKILSTINSASLRNLS